MPIYEFACAECGVHFDRLQKLSDPDPDACAACGGHSLRRCVTAPSFRLAGNGWYETDFKRDTDKRRNLVGDDKPAAPADAVKSDSGKTDSSKPDASPAPSSPAPTKTDAKAKTAGAD